MSSFIAALTFLLAAIAFLYGLNSWRREFLGKRRLEALEKVLAMFYEARDAIRYIRSPLSWGNEGGSRPRQDGENQAEGGQRDRAFVPHERYQKHEKLFSELASQKYSIMALFGEKYSEPFEGIRIEINNILGAAHSLGTYYWLPIEEGLTKEQVVQHREMRRDYEKTIWFGIDGDLLAARVNSHISVIEELSRKQSIAIETSKLDELLESIIKKIKK